MAFPNESGSSERAPLLVHGEPPLGVVAPQRSSSSRRLIKSPPAGSAATRTASSSGDATPGLPKADTDSSWPEPAGLPPRNAQDENLQIFRRAVGINSGLSTVGDAGSLEEGRRTATGIYLAVVRECRAKHWQFVLLNASIYLCHFCRSPSAPC